MKCFTAGCNLGKTTAYLLPDQHRNGVAAVASVGFVGKPEEDNVQVRRLFDALEAVLFVAAGTNLARSRSKNK